MATTLDSYLTLGHSGLRVSPLTLGAMTFGEDWGWGTDARGSERILDTYLAAGGNVIDTANLYTNGHSEAILGDLLSSRPGLRDRIVLGTKFFANLHPGDPNGGGAGRKALLDQVTQSLRRLRTDYVDLLWLHQWDRSTPIEETMRTLDDLVRAGTVRYLGVSDVPAWVASEAQTLARLRGWTPITAYQLEHSLLERTAEGAVLPMCAHHGIGAMAWSPLRHGALSGKYRRDRARMADPPSATGRSTMFELSERDWTIVEELIAVAAEIGASPAATAIAWVTRRPGITSTLVGARTAEQLEANLGALAVDLDDGHRQRLDAASAPTLDFPAMYEQDAVAIQFAGTIVDGHRHPDNPLLEHPTRY